MKVSKPKRVPLRFSRTPVAAGILVALASPTLLAQEATVIEEIIVTSQKRSENLQDVPISVQALGNQELEELNLKNFKEYVQMLPSVAMTPTLGAGSSFNLVYMRGIATAGDGQATTSQPSVGMYLDELPITTIQGNLDVHMYDIARVEALAGPQGTLFGASSQSGTIRVITNRPDPTEFSAGYGVEGNIVDGDDTGYVLEGFVNIPMGESAAIRLVGWSRSDAGWVDNVLGSRTFPGVEWITDPASPDPLNPLNLCDSSVDCTADDVTLTNTGKAADNYNTIETTGGRAALTIDLNDNWTIIPSAMAQKSESKGSWGDDLSDFVPGDNAVTHFKDEFTDDQWYMLGLTIEGKIGNFDLVYSGSYLDREVDGSFDYSDYSYWYDTIYSTGYYADLHFADTGARTIPNQFVPSYWNTADVGTRVMTGARFTNNDGYTKKNHEIRISSPQDNRFRGLLGFFWQEQYHDFEQHWEVDGGVATILQMNQGTDPRFTNTVYLNSLERWDTDQAVFATLAYDITDDIELTVGARFFQPEVKVKGFFGFGAGFGGPWSGTGELECNLVEGEPGWTPDFDGQNDYKNKPCLNVDKGISESDHVGRLNVSWTLSDDSMVYATWSEGYRPGGINRKATAGEYVSDFVTNWEAGWKTQWMNNTFQFNGAVFYSTWDDFQVSFTGANAITQVDNGPSARVSGLEGQFLWLPTDNLRLTAAFTFIDSELLDDYVNLDSAGNVTRVLAPKGTKLPVTADFKGNIVARYSFDIGRMDSYVQGVIAYEGERMSDMDQADNDIRGNVPAYTILDLSAGVAGESWQLDLFIKNAANENAPLYLTGQCTPATCGGQTYGVRVRPTTIGLKFSQQF